MSNKNKILVGCLALLLALSVGYALFSETITINGTATAKGSFDIEASCQTGVLSSIESTYVALGNQIFEENGYENDTCGVTNNVVSFSTDLKYPTAAKNFTIKFENKGTIAAKAYLVKNGAATAAVDTRKYCIYNSTTNAQVSCGTMANGSNYYFTTPVVPLFVKEDGSFATSQTDLDNFIITEGNDQYFKLEPGQSGYMVIGVQWLDGMENLLEDNQYFKFNISVVLDWQQVTN